ncbi:MAG: bifunctional DNA-formamidopyrimidine glycosylase/DNA-(apurinic or apyrimidinic site) lyase [Gemmatimonadales bacterium]|jgi:formamidopyrimidine-DNA glycosylase|nr:MAG: bifunctional DNA-formamidopyrimidine glycosylase/DNA-(apurinic or apyrimidinic site) lyase [Gemmatimonadales bacterium]
MPELPEAEALVRSLRPLLPGYAFDRVQVLRPDVLRVPAREFRQAVSGRRVTEVGRRAKNIVLTLDSGAAHLVVNLGMTGALVPLGFPEVEPPRPTHPALRFFLGSGRSLVYDDVRRFGCVEFLTAAEWADRTRRLGPEPLSAGYGWQSLHQGLQASRTPVRNWLLDQRKIAGVGNIYASEACFRARVHPQRRADRITEEEAKRLHRGLRQVLRSAIRHGGTTLRDYRDASGEPGRNRSRLRVYGREGLPCWRCKTPVQRIVFGNRSAFLCPSCQC